MRILIVDDDRQSRLLMRRFLDDMGRCEEEENGKSAVGAFVRALAEGEPYGLVCMDIVMPDMDGVQTVRLMREIERRWDVQPGGEARVLMATAKDDVKSVSQAFFHGCATDYAVKPLDKAVFRQKAEALLQGIDGGVC
jgi:two-component system chemotaxis response regulator CheY